MKEANFKYLVEGISADIVRYLIEDVGITLSEALSLFYNSECFALLGNSDTSLYLYSSAYIYELLKSEIRFGRIVIPSGQTTISNSQDQSGSVAQYA